MTQYIEDGRVPAEPPLSTLLTNEELETLVLMLGYGQQPAGFSDADIEAVVSWAEKARMNAGLLDNILAGSFCCSVAGGEVKFGLTPKGQQEAEAMVDGFSNRQSDENGQTTAKENPL